ncbi:DUF1501 domain-containing protein [Loktanella sp. SALINAS62]|uniref:DUF1501 domain-containing protein n=1 Tax=Loktanella sp. SALINAS62 TaxID=2706124 RepID=UPI001B8B9CC5|nr:DUF1501 domain-containing protein [Loktanella sp. SALINAS62]MBS1304003.1 DUF1501 domain-containing protein [Loktanella sp. SALINAS62]
MDRRTFLANGAALGCSLAASPLMTPIAFASGPWDARLVVIVLRGAMDGLDAVRPVGDPDFMGLRSRMPMELGLPVDPFWELHPALAPLLPLWDRGQFGALHATSTPYRGPRSHFDAQDLLEAGTMQMGQATGGWLNRMLGVVPGMTADTAFAIGRDQSAILSGPHPVMQWSPQSRLDMTPQTRRLLELILHDDPLFRNAALEAVNIADSLTAEAAEAEDAQDTGAMMMVADSAKKDADVVARFAAQRLRADTRIASFSLNGWDTHGRQHISLRRALDNLARVITTLHGELGPIWDRTAVLCVTEFGRTARENGTLGTDHGTGGAMLFAGGALDGGQVLGRWPGLSEADLFERRDLMPTVDVRAAAGGVMRDLFGLPRDAIETIVFPGLDLSDAPQLVL